MDVRWHGGWWEGIVIQKESENKIHVYFPGLDKFYFIQLHLLLLFMFVFINHWASNCYFLHFLQGKSKNQYSAVKERPDAVNSILSCLGMKLVLKKTRDGNAMQISICVNGQLLKDSTELKRISFGIW